MISDSIQDVEFSRGIIGASTDTDILNLIISTLCFDNISKC